MNDIEKERGHEIGHISVHKDVTKWRKTASGWESVKGDVESKTKNSENKSNNDGNISKLLDKVRDEFEFESVSIDEDNKDTLVISDTVKAYGDSFTTKDTYEISKLNPKSRLKSELDVIKLNERLKSLGLKFKNIRMVIYHD